MKKLFGTDGMRGEAGVFPLDVPTVRIVGASLALHLQEKLDRTPVLVVGRDTRESGGWLEQALVEGAESKGARCMSAGVITTPGVAYLARAIPADAGVVLSASHNEFKDNGIKIFSPSGRKLEEKTEALIEADIRANKAGARGSDQRPLETSRIESSSQESDNNAESMQDQYLDFLSQEIGKGLTLNGLRIVIDCANGAAYALAPKLFKRLGANVTAINDKPDGRNINRDCGSLHMHQLQNLVRSAGADLGVAFDGDADRALFVDSSGKFVDGDATLWALAKHMQKENRLKNSAVIATVMSNIGLEIALNTIGLQLIRTDVGDKYVLDELLRSGSSLGGEQSGHIIFPALSLAGDGLITTLCLLRAMKESATTLAELTEGIERFPQVLLNVRVSEKVNFAEIPLLPELTSEIATRLGSNGRLLLRYSGTEPLARIMIEGPNQSEIENYANDVAVIIRETIGADC